MTIVRKVEAMALFRGGPGDHSHFISANDERIKVVLLAATKSRKDAQLVATRIRVDAQAARRTAGLDSVALSTAAIPCMTDSSTPPSIAGANTATLLTVSHTPVCSTSATAPRAAAPARDSSTVVCHPDLSARIPHPPPGV